jgi:ABC-type uncharacterized transport system substrate-binding protein
MSKSFVRTLKLVLSAAFLILMVLLLTWFKLTQPRILVLHSYDKGYEWTRDIDIGLKHTLDPKLRYRVYTHYMDVKNHPDKEFKRKAELLARRAIDSLNPTLIIAVDDDAQLVVKEFNNKPGISIVFAGINGEIEPYGYNKASNVTGILERKSMVDIRQALIAMRTGSGKPLGTRLFQIGDTSNSVLADDQQMRKFDWSPLTLVDSKNARTFDEWKAAVIEAGKRADILLISNYRAVYRTQGKPEVVPPREIMRWTEQNSVIPAVGMAGFFTDDGGMFAIGTSGFEQGEVTGRMAIRVLDDDVVPRDIPVIMPQQFIVYMNKSVMKKRDLTLPRLYESFARATNNFSE